MTEDSTINLQEIIKNLLEDLKNEWTHMRFYLYHASAVTGLHRHEFKELFLKEAGSEMQHVLEFSDCLRGLGFEPHADSHDFPKLSDPREIVAHALKMEEEVVSNYAERIGMAEQLGGVQGHWLEIFLEKQLEHSREDVDEYRQMLKGL